MRHEARAWAEDGEIKATLAHEAQLVVLDRFAQLVVADAQLGRMRHFRGIRDAGDLPVAPRLERLGRGRVMAVDVDDHRVTPVRALWAIEPKFSGRLRRPSAGPSQGCRRLCLRPR